MILAVLIIAGMWVLLGYQHGDVQPAFQPTPTPTRTADSYFREAQAYFQAGKLDDPDPAPPAPPTRTPSTPTGAPWRPTPPTPWPGRRWRASRPIRSTCSAATPSAGPGCAEALEFIDKAVELDPDDSTVHAVRAFVLDWNASYASETEAQTYLKEAEGEAVHAYQLDPDNALALAFYAEVSLDQQKWQQAEEYAARPSSGRPIRWTPIASDATVLESLAQYRRAIEEYLKASEINPNLTFLYAYIGRDYLRLRVYDRALDTSPKPPTSTSSSGCATPSPTWRSPKRIPSRASSSSPPAMPRKP